MPLSTIEKQISDKYLKQYLDNLAYKPDGYYQINKEILAELKIFKKAYPKHGHYLELKYVLGKTSKQIQKEIAYAKSQSFQIQSEALSLFINYINSKSLTKLSDYAYQHQPLHYSINQKN